MANLSKIQKVLTRRCSGKNDWREIFDSDGQSDSGGSPRVSNIVRNCDISPFPINKG